MGNLNPEYALHDPLCDNKLNLWCTSKVRRTTSFLNYLNTQQHTPSTAKRKYNYPENGSSTRLQNTDYMVPYPRSQYEKLFKKPTKFELQQESTQLAGKHDFQQLINLSIRPFTV